MKKSTPNNPFAGTVLEAKLDDLPFTYPELAMRTNKPGAEMEMPKKLWQALNTAYPQIMDACFKADRLKSSLVYGAKLRDFNYSAFPAPQRKLKPSELELLHAILGIISEGGELLQMYMDRLNSGHPIDRTNAVEEIGDLEWFMQLARKSVICTQEETMMINIKKLAERFPDGFSEEMALVRNEEAERKLLEEETKKLDK
ncbi:nucleotide pyrophosphohydrolase [Vibrio phage SHOU24]|uniref:MazG-like pyrophosphatase n=1 Tax=Vibrio phage SHOU24 TaxID=1414739 RepID=UPI0003ED1C5E|nr:MazG-like pyrophosphatase [Vibrio phage SHOU24]AHI61228.1 nucleotide pyrophosphohydrolase [Vibrio phage SHOU24]